MKIHSILIIFLDNAEKKTSKPKILAIWRNFLLFCFGIIHLSIWEGDILAPYAICAFLLIIFPKVENPKFIFSAIVFLALTIGGVFTLIKMGGFTNYQSMAITLFSLFVGNLIIREFLAYPKNSD